MSVTLELKVIISPILPSRLPVQPLLRPIQYWLLLTLTNEAGSFMVLPWLLALKYNSCPVTPALFLAFIIPGELYEVVGLTFATPYPVAEGGVPLVVPIAYVKTSPLNLAV